MKNLGLNKSQEAFLDMFTKGTWTYNPATGLVDVKGGFDCSYQGLKDFKGVRFGKVSGRFDCRGNKLTSLEGAPQVVGWRFDCSNNLLTSLAGAPQEVGDSFICYGNQLTSLEGAPQVVRNSFCCHNNQLTRLAGAPQKVGGRFDCRGNKLTSLEGAPQVVGGRFDCRGNNLTSLKGAPLAPQNPYLCDFWCDAFRSNRWKKGWNLESWLNVVRRGGLKTKKLLVTLLPADTLNKEIQKDPARMIMSLKEVWNDENFKETRSKLVLPKGYELEADLVGDLYGAGF